MRGIKVGVIVKKQFRKNGDTAQDVNSEKKEGRELRAADPEAHQKFVNNLFSVVK